jgi:OHCU decarboxylase
MTSRDFVDSLAAIFEYSPWVAERAFTARPFNSRLELETVMRRVVSSASAQEQLALICAHPRLGARKFHRVELTEASTNEQRRAGLDAMTEVEVARLLQLNMEYEHKFSFPFILAVRGHDPVSILAAITGRLENTVEEERARALEQIDLIGAYRLADLVSE